MQCSIEWITVMNAACDAMITAAETLKRYDLPLDQRQDVCERLAGRAVELRLAAAEIAGAMLN
jgi:hypothetical protein